MEPVRSKTGVARVKPWGLRSHVSLSLAVAMVFYVNLPLCCVLMTAGAPTPSSGRGGSGFATTRWSVVLQAGGPTSQGSAVALEELCRTYWYPVYSYARRTGHSAHDAEDLTQSFFAFLLEKDGISRANRERGRFRGFLLTAFKNYSSKERARNSAARRGGGRDILSLDKLKAENRYRLEPQTAATPETLYDQKWAASLLGQAVATMRSEYAVQGKESLFNILRSVVWGDHQDTTYADLARQTGLSEGAFKVAVHRLRGRFRECLRQEVAQTVGNPEEVDDELRALLSALRG
jgi:RNA polymerase sigma factor (sigma-70 family)